MKLIVNADDFGYDPGINKGVIHAFRKGIVTSTTIMVNQPYCEEAAKLAAQEPELGVGLHVNLTRGRPVSSAENIPGLLSEAGIFWEPDSFYQQKVEKSEVQKEIAAQLDKLMNLGISPTHMDAHHHLHFHPVVLEVMVELAGKYRLPLRHVDKNTCSYFQRMHIPTPDFFVSSFFGEDATVDNLVSILTELNTESPGSAVEVMCHPGFINDFTAESSYQDPRQKELEVLCSKEIKELIYSLNIQLINFKSLNINRC
ncbi:chitin disaccharide deacetylase [Candidatus Contubernalis alkaliaceticus]|uniref:chitin disaccharide deacetylase n=1 Tax=Candidatus Contubernalis alkaliaceticus TaxID=338645 RepID=UPI001F4BD197|nr:chitin disaccharide deacetylase [Candidatus Contubernalis alkalaceticus]UNC91421.1 chitin disaccharide deacetylase [Candidatus Contubernalis alkalaceticus]